MILILSFLWFIRTTKVILFYLYLWQLKEYRISRFLDHFRTEKGKKLVFNKLILLKLFLLGSFFILQILILYVKSLPWHLFGVLILVSILLILYLFESVKTFYVFFRKKLKAPVLTKKTLLLIVFGILIEILFIFTLFRSQIYIYALAGQMESLRMVDIYNAVGDSIFPIGLILFDILTPIITSAIVLIFQPLAVLGRNQIIKKAKRKRAKFKDLLVVGITGSYGKTSTKEFLATILSEKLHPVKSAEGGAKQFNRVNILKTQEHQNTEIGVSQCILNDLKPEHEIFICEMGAYKRGEIKLLGDITKPKIGILTGINEQHLATFGSQENIIKAKYELIESIPEDGLAIFNGDNSYCLELYKKTLIEKEVYSLQSSILGKPPDIWAHNVKTEKDFITFRVYSKADSADFKVNVFGAQNVLNILGAVAVAKKLGMSLEEIARACQKIKPEQSGMQLKKGINGLNIIDASYSANPDGVISHLEYLKIWGGKKVIVMPCLIELGSSSIEVHKRIGQKIGEVCDLSIITTKERFKEIREGAPNALFIENPKEILEKIKNFCQEVDEAKPHLPPRSASLRSVGDVVLLESRVPRELMKRLASSQPFANARVINETTNN